jgi:hypothetical protein
LPLASIEAAAAAAAAAAIPSRFLCTGGSSSVSLNEPVMDRVFTVNRSRPCRGKPSSRFHTTGHITGTMIRTQ